MAHFIDDTIAAVATPGGEGGIGIVRISGPEAKAIFGAVFSAGKNAEDIKPRELTYGHIIDRKSGDVIDEVLAVYMPAPSTYTKEDVVEIDCHGGSIAVGRVLNEIIANGARLAEPGEFTKKAFLNGRIDLSQAEAVLDIINAKTETSLDVAISQLQGKFSEEVTAIRKALTDILVDIDVNIDYPDEDIEELTYEKLAADLSKAKNEIDELIDTAQAGKIVREGLSIVIVGPPNAGKSTLLNALLRESRAIVTDIPGTTRDTIEEYSNIRGIPVKLTDTAGIRETEDLLESIGIERTKESIASADLSILVVDMSEEIDEETKAVIESIDRKKTILVFNKDDLERKLEESKLAEIAEGFADVLVLSIKENEKEAVKSVEDAIFRLSGYSTDPGADANRVNKEKYGFGPDAAPSKIAINQRHKVMLTGASTALADAIDATKNKAALELIEIDVRSAYEQMGFITGDSVQEDIIDEIFSRFCLGK